MGFFCHGGRAVFAFSLAVLATSFSTGCRKRQFNPAAQVAVAAFSTEKFGSCVSAPDLKPATQALGQSTSKDSELRILLVGDPGTGGEQQRRVARAMKSACRAGGKEGATPCQAALLLGDMFYEVGVKHPYDAMFKTHFKDFYEDLGIPFWAILGNHDYGNPTDHGDPFMKLPDGTMNFNKLEDGSRAPIVSPETYVRYSDMKSEFAADAEGFRKKAEAEAKARGWDLPKDFVPSRTFEMPSRCYDFRYDFAGGSVDFFALDTMALNESQRRWLESRLSDSRARGERAEKPVYRVVFGHHPIFSFGSHGHTMASYDSAGKARGLDEKLLPLLCQEANIYVAGHEHDQELLRARDKKACPLPMLVSGTAGKVRDVQSQAKDAKSLRVFVDNGPGFSVLVFNADGMTLKMYSVNKDDEPVLLLSRVLAPLDNKRSPR